MRLGLTLAEIGIPFGFAEPLGVGVVVAAITYVSLIVGELVPKQIALRRPEQIAVRVAPAMTILARIASPLVWLLDASGRALLWVLGQHSKETTNVTDEEIHILVAEAENAGVIEPGERAMISGVMRLGDRPVRGVMTPRREVEMIDLSQDAEDIRKTILDSVHSRLPAHEGVPDEMLGVIQAKDLLDAYMAGRRPDVRDHVRVAPTVSDTADALDVVSIINQSPVHIALVHDEYGHFEGVVTNADILEAIIGVSQTDEEPIVPDALQRDDGSWLIEGHMEADEMADRLAIVIPHERAYHTAAGFVLNRVGHLPGVRRILQRPGLALRGDRPRRPPHRQDSGDTAGEAATAVTARGRSAVTLCPPSSIPPMSAAPSRTGPMFACTTLRRACHRSGSSRAYR